MDSSPDCFHRTIFIFMCTNPKCHSPDSPDSPDSPFVVFRTQLPRKNDFYPFEAPEIKPHWRPDLKVNNRVKLCNLCGISGPKTCSACKKVTYCGKDHQVLDWKSGHKSECKDPNFKYINPILLPEFEIVTEPAESEDYPDENEDAEVEETEMEKFQELQREDKTGGQIPDSEFDGQKEPDLEDEIMIQFKKVTSHSPDQVSYEDIYETF